ncbi:MAG: phage tail protein [Faecousia sp.]
MNVQVTAGGVLAYDSRLPDEKGYNMESIRISDAINKGGSAVLILPPQHPLRDGFRAFQTDVVIYRDGKIRWRGRPLPGSCDKYNRRTITCEGELCFLQDATLRPCTITADPATIFTQIIQSYNATVEPWKRFAVGTVTVSADSVVTFSADKAQVVYSAVQSLIKSYGGYILFDSAPDGTRRINWYDALPYACNQRIRWGINMTDFSTSTDSSSFATRIVPYGSIDKDGNRITINIDGKDYVENAEALDQYGVIEIPKIYNGISDPAELQAAAQRDVDRASAMPETIQISALDLSRQDSSLDAFCVGQRVYADSESHKLSGLYDIVSMEEDLVNPSVGQIKLTRQAAYFDGTGSTLSGSISGAPQDDQGKQQFTTILNAVADLTSTLLGAKGGCIRKLDTDGDGMPDTVYVANDPDPEKATKVWRINYEGFGASKNGYNGPFVLGATLEDGFLADIITAGTLNAALVKIINLIVDHVRSVNGSSTLEIDGARVALSSNVMETFSVENFDDGVAYLYFTQYDADGNMICRGQFGANRATVGGSWANPDAGMYASNQDHGGLLRIDEIEQMPGSQWTPMVFGTPWSKTGLKTMLGWRKKLYSGYCAQGNTCNVSGADDYELFAIRLGSSTATKETVILAVKQGSVVRGIGGWCGTSINKREIYYVSCSISGDTWTLEDAGYNAISESGTMGSGIRLALKEVLGLI